MSYELRIDHLNLQPFADDFGVAQQGVGFGTVRGHQDHARLARERESQPIDPDGAAKATQFLQLCDQANRPVIFFNNTTGYMVGTDYEQAGMIKHGSKMIQAVSNLRVPRITLYVGLWPRPTNHLSRSANWAGHSGFTQ